MAKDNNIIYKKEFDDLKNSFNDLCDKLSEIGFKETIEFDDFKIDEDSFDYNNDDDDDEIFDYEKENDSKVKENDTGF